MSCKTYARIDVWQGHELQLEFYGASAPPPDGFPFDFTDATAVFLLKNQPSDTDDQALVTATTENGGIEITDSINGRMVATITGEASEMLVAQTYGCPYRDYYAQFRVTLRTGQLTGSSPFIVRFHQGVIRTFAT
jgi:hypothetical protein